MILLKLHARKFDVFRSYFIEKAYDRVLRENLLGKYGVDGRLLLAVKSLLAVCVRVGWVKSQPFAVHFGFGCVRQPFFFIVCMNWIGSNNQVNEGVTVRSCRINGLLFADDLVSLASIGVGTGNFWRVLIIFCPNFPKNCYATNVLATSFL